MREKGRVKMVQVARIASPLAEYPMFTGTESQHLPFLQKFSKISKKVLVP